MKFNINEVLIQARLSELASEALEAYKVITEAYKNAFSLGTTQLHCYTSYSGDIHRTAFLSINGIWEYSSDYSNKTISVEISPNGIFVCFVAELAEYLRNGTLGSTLQEQLDVLLGLNSDKKAISFDFGLTDEEKQLSEAASDLRNFVENCKEKINRKEDSDTDNNENDAW